MCTYNRFLAEGVSLPSVSLCSRRLSSQGSECALDGHRTARILGAQARHWSAMGSPPLEDTRWVNSIGDQPTVQGAIRAQLKCCVMLNRRQFPDFFITRSPIPACQVLQHQSSTLSQKWACSCISHKLRWRTTVFVLPCWLGPPRRPQGKHCSPDPPDLPERPGNHF